MVPPPFKDKVRVRPSAESSHFSIAGCHLTIPQKSPILAHRASAESFEAALAADSSAGAASPEKSSAVPAATAVLIPMGLSLVSRRHHRRSLSEANRTKKMISRLAAFVQPAGLSFFMPCARAPGGEPVRLVAVFKRRDP